MKECQENDGSYLLFSLQHGIELWVTLKCLCSSERKETTPDFTVADTTGMVSEDTVVFCFADTAALLFVGLAAVSLADMVVFLLTDA